MVQAARILVLIAMASLFPAVALGEVWTAEDMPQPQSQNRITHDERHFTHMALEHAKDQLKLHDDADLRLHVGRLAFELGLFDEAGDNLERALALSANSSTTQTANM